MLISLTRKTLNGIGFLADPSGYLRYADEVSTTTVVAFFDRDTSHKDTIFADDIVRRLDGSPASDQFMHTVVGGDAVILVKRIVRRADLEAHHISTNAVNRAGENSWGEDPRFQRVVS